MHKCGRGLNDVAITLFTVNFFNCMAMQVEMGVNLNLALTQHFQHATLDSMDWVANLFVSVTKITPCHVTLLMDTVTVILDGLGKSALYVSRFD